MIKKLKTLCKKFIYRRQVIALHHQQVKKQHNYYSIGFRQHHFTQNLLEQLLRPFTSTSPLLELLFRPFTSTNFFHVKKAVAPIKYLHV